MSSIGDRAVKVVGLRLRVAGGLEIITNGLVPILNNRPIKSYIRIGIEFILQTGECYKL